MNSYPSSLERLINSFRRFPGIGFKTAERLSLHTLNMKPEELEEFSNSLLDVKNKIHKCPICGNLTDKAICGICSDPLRDRSIICVVKDSTHLITLEKSGTYNGLYHVLGELISPLKSISEKDINIDKLYERIEKSKDESQYDEYIDEEVKEVIFAISSTVEGDTTILFMSDKLKELGVEVSKIATGIPLGGSLVYYDELTIAKALEDRRDI